MPAVNCVEQALRAAPKELDMILMGDMNTRLGDPCDEREEDLSTVLVDMGMVNMMDHFMHRRRCRGPCSWTWRMQWEGCQVTGMGEYTLSFDRHNFTNMGLRK